MPEITPVFVGLSVYKETINIACAEFRAYIPHISRAISAEFIF